ncbi:hypothetical protein FQR65_LT18617 [Abscondita terminalis]|nr:hypothetical protein FQR65_LT18617 [Abscondita terminalis]
MVKNREIEKTYWAIVPKEMIPLEQKLVHYLRKNEKNNKATVFEKVTEGAKDARLHYKVIMTLDNYYLLEIDLETGRHHQIRAQLAKVGIPIKGDLKYGAPRSNPDGGIHLHARKTCLSIRQAIAEGAGQIPRKMIFDGMRRNSAKLAELGNICTSLGGYTGGITFQKKMPGGPKAVIAFLRCASWAGVSVT